MFPSKGRLRYIVSVCFFLATEIVNNFQLKIEIEIATEIERSHPSRLHNPIHFSD